MLTVTFYAHASFRLSGDGLVVVTDPYAPGPAGAGFAPIDEPADLVLMSSATDSFHSDPSHVRGEPLVVNTLDLPPEGATVGGLYVRPFPTMENQNYDFGRDPDTNAMYLFTLGGLRVLHMGDVGNPIAADQLAALAGQVDILLALTGGEATIALDDLDAMIDAIRPRVVIPMHYYSQRGVLKILPVEAFTARYPADKVVHADGPSVTLDPAALPTTLQIIVLEQSR
jgi:L-ascorbate metabolism protein UlaG (beta-lactamase superfamily)